MLRLEDVNFALEVAWSESSEKTGVIRKKIKGESWMSGTPKLMPHLNLHRFRIVRVIPFRPIGNIHAVQPF